MEIHSITITFPANRKEMDDIFFNHFGSFLAEFSRHSLEEFFKVQSDSPVKSVIKGRLTDLYLKDLSEDNEKFSKLHNMILGCHLSQSANPEVLFALKKEAVEKHLATFSFEKLAGMYDYLMEDEDEYPHFFVSAFAALLIEKVSHKESVESIRLAWKYHSEHAWTEIGLKIEKKLDLKFAE